MQRICPMPRRRRKCEAIRGQVRAGRGWCYGADVPEWSYQPDPARAATSRIGRLLRAHDLPPTPDGYAALQRLSIADPERFWRTVLRDLGFEWLTPFSRVLDASKGPAWPRWFPDGRINAAQLCVDRWLPARRDAVAVLW